MVNTNQDTFKFRILFYISIIKMFIDDINTTIKRRLNGN